MPAPEGWRYVAVDPRTGEFLDWDVPLRGVTLTRRLSGPWELSASVEPEYPHMIGNGDRPPLDMWGTAIWADHAGTIRGGGIVTTPDPDGSKLGVTCEGYTRYPHGIPYLGQWTPPGAVDPMTSVGLIWDHLQSYPDGDLGVELVGDLASNARIGTAEQPYQLAWWNNTDCGDEFEAMAIATPFDFVEEHAWAADGSDAIEHKIRITQPTQGRRRDDLVFVEGENLALTPKPEYDGDAFAQYVLGLGAGEGRARVRSSIRGRADHRLRRLQVLDRNDVMLSTTINSLARSRALVTSVPGSVGTITVKDHPNARLGSWELGDEILVETRNGWGRGAAVWCRIVEEKINPETADAFATLTLTRADGL